MNTQCKCGKASMSYEVIGEDLYMAKAVNTIIKKEGYGKVCICRFCNKQYDNFDPFMVKFIDERYT